jgi:hypothetical protein
VDAPVEGVATGAVVAEAEEVFCRWGGGCVG